MLIQKNLPKKSEEVNKWTSMFVADRLREASETLRRLPSHHPGRKITSSWPDYVRDISETFTDLSGEEKPSPPTAVAIDRMDEVLMDWIKWLDKDEIRILWSWVLGVPAGAVAKRMGVHRATVHRRRIAALKKIAVFLNSNGRLLNLAEAN